MRPVEARTHIREEWEEKIGKFHAKHQGMSRAEAMMEYLKVRTHVCTELLLPCLQC